MQELKRNSIFTDEEIEERARELERARQRDWRNKNKRKIREYNRQWRIENREKIREYDRQWRAENPDKVKEYRKRHLRKKAIESLAMDYAGGKDE